jgi:hypothetical protein
MRSVVIALLTIVVNHQASARPAIVFDLDHTLVDTNLRTIVILRDLAVELEIPELFAVTTEQVERLRRHDRHALSLRPGTSAKIFGARGRGPDQRSRFGQKFYFDSSYLKHDGLIPGGPEFVARLARETDADIYYITGRFKNEFEAATREQLAYWDFPGFSPKHPVPGSATLILKPNEFEGPTDAFKIAEFRKLAATGAVIATFDDARRNVAAFAELLPHEVPIVRISRDVGDRRDVPLRVEQITNYLFNGVRREDGEMTYASNGAQLEAVLMRAKACARQLGTTDAAPAPVVPKRASLLNTVVDVVDRGRALVTRKFTSNGRGKSGVEDGRP